jgi:hypothetical protein
VRRAAVALAALAIGAALALPAAAAAIPIRNLRAESDVGDYSPGAALIAVISADVFSPPRAEGCGARVTFAIRDPARHGRRVRGETRRINVCRHSDGGGLSHGSAFAIFDVTRLRHHRYRITVRATQRVAGEPSTHSRSIARVLGRR